MENLALARRLAAYGRAQQDAAALAVAAKILWETPHETLAFDASSPDARRKESDSAAAMRDQISDAERLPEDAPLHLDPDTFIEAASILAAENEVLAAWINDLIADRQSQTGLRGALVKVKAREAFVPEGAENTHLIIFEGGEWARVSIATDPDARLVMEVYDENGVLIEPKSAGANNINAAWMPSWRGPFTIKVKNLGLDSESYHLSSN